MDFSKEMVDEILKIFQVESEEIISRLNNGLLDLEKNPINKDAVLGLFRDAHTLKGASRMVGFNNVQMIAHKIEDILGLVKENKLLLTSQVIDILYKTVDFLSDLIKKSIEKGKEIYSENIPKQIAILESIQKNFGEADFKQVSADFQIKLLSPKIERVNCLISQCLYILMNIEIVPEDSSQKKMLSIIEELCRIFQKSGPFEIQKCLENIKAQLEFFYANPGSLSKEDLENIHKTLEIIVNKLVSICEIYGLQIVDYYAMAFSEKFTLCSEANEVHETFVDITNFMNEGASQEEDKKVEYKKEEEPEFCDTYDLTCKIKGKFIELSKNICSPSEVKELILNFQKDCLDDNIKHIFEKIVKVLDFAQENDIQFDEENTSILIDSVDYCDDIIKNKNEIADKELILQRLEIIQQVLEFNQQKEYEQNLMPKGGYRIQNKKIADFSEIFNTGEIKTLRVEASKLDTLVNQVSELSITKIKTKKHLHGLDTINKDLEEWQRNSVKALNYLKYYDKKHFQSEANSQISFFIRQLISLFVANNKKVQESVTDIGSLYRTIQEDDIKMGLIVDNLAHMIKNVRVLPLATIFHLFGRMVRDIAKEKNKDIELEIIGSETSTDKKIIEEIKMPLIHLIRNSIDHGIETPEKRVALGKSPTGKIVLSARQHENRVLIEIQDDGSGINLEKIKEKAVQKGYLTQEEINSMTNEQITNIIFAPGFSTGDEITNISGRGIGLDVVQTKISQLNGKVRVISEVDKGCCVQIELPTTMSTVKVFVVKSSNQIFAIPIESINTVLRKCKDEIILNKGTRAIIFQEKTVPLYNLSNILGIKTEASTKDKETVLVIENGDKMIALSVDNLIGDQEILSKKLPAPFYKLKSISGITTLISGEICLILNGSEVINTANNPKSQIEAVKTNQNRNNSDYKILLVDDSITTTTLEKNILTKAGYCIEIAKNPIEALKMIQTTGFDLIITDIEMPEMNGFEFIEKLKTDEMFFEIPVVMVSSLISDEAKRRAFELGVKKYIIKSEFNQDEFRQAVDSILCAG